MQSEIMNLFKQSIQAEAEALLSILDIFGEEVIQTVERIEAMKGRLIICGLGKSGHIGRKIAATMASTGTPAFFVHAAEASHGDLGMITKDDVVLMLSNSGETAELIALIPSLREIGATYIALTASPSSSLAKQADIVLAYGRHAETDHLNAAPTVSALITLAVGDALAVVLSKRRGFAQKDFHRYHPGGSLGKRLKKG